MRTFALIIFLTSYGGVDDKPFHTATKVGDYTTYAGCKTVVAVLEKLDGIQALCVPEGI